MMGTERRTGRRWKATRAPFSGRNGRGGEIRPAKPFWRESDKFREREGRALALKNASFLLCSVFSPRPSERP